MSCATIHDYGGGEEGWCGPPALTPGPALVR